MKKTDVYVVVDTPKKAKKLKKVLDMFGENHFSDIHKVKFNDCVGNVVHFWANKYFAYCSSWAIKNKTEVSIKELRNILAKEHLKAGDIVLTKNGNDKIISIVNKTCNSNVALFEAKRWIRLHDGFKWDNKGCFDDFIRYATEEEKALLNPIDEFTDSDIAIVERLHDTLLDNHGYSLGSKLLTDARMLSNKIKSNIK